MIQRAFKFDGEAAPASHARTFRLDATNGSGGRLATFRVSLATDSAASIRPIAQSTKLDLEFRKVEYNTLSSTSPAPAGTKANHAVGALIKLDAPRELVRIRMASGTDALKKSAQISLHRVDGNAASEEPTLRASPSPAGTFAIPAGFVDRRVVIKTAAAGTLTAADISEVVVRSFPTGPRVRLSLPLAMSEPAQVWSAPGEFDRSSEVPMLSVQIGAALADVLARLLADAARPMPEFVHVDVHVESDAPCEVTIKQCEIAYAIESRVPSDGEPIVLRFPGGAETSRTIDLPIPAGASITRAEINAVESFSGSTANAPPTNNGPALDALRQSRGVEITAGHKGGVFIATAAPLRFAGIALGLVALSQSATAEASVHRGDLDVGVGELLAAGALRPAGRSWATALFDKPVIVQPPGAWVVVAVHDGALAWLADDDQTHDAFIAGHGERLERGHIIRGVHPAVVLLPTRDASATTANGALRVRLADIDVPRTTIGDRGDVLYDVTAALTAHLGAASASPRTTRVDLSTPLRGIITIRSIALEYDLA